MNQQTERQAWLAERQKFVGASEVASLFEKELSAHGEKPYQPYYKLWHIKAGVIEPENLDNKSYIQSGRFLEDGAAKWFAEKAGYKVWQADEHLQDVDCGLAATPDFYVYKADSLIGCLETKVISAAQFSKWDDEPPLKFELQLQTQMGLKGLKKGWIAALVIGDYSRDLVVFEREFRPKAFAKIQKAARAFWQSIKTNDRPDADYQQHYAIIAEIYGQADTAKEIDLTGHNEAGFLAEKHYHLGQQINQLKAERDATKAQLLEIIGDAAKAFGEGFKISADMVNRAETVLPANTYRNFRLTLKKG